MDDAEKGGDAASVPQAAPSDADVPTSNAGGDAQPAARSMRHSHHRHHHGGDARDHDASSTSSSTTDNDAAPLESPRPAANENTPPSNDALVAQPATAEGDVANLNTTQQRQEQQQGNQPQVPDQDEHLPLQHQEQDTQEREQQQQQQQLRLRAGSVKHLDRLVHAQSNVLHHLTDEELRAREMLNRIKANSHVFCQMIVTDSFPMDSLCSALETNTKLTHLLISLESNLSSQFVSCLCQGLKKNTKVSFLSLRLKALDEGSLAIGEILESNKSLKYLRLSSIPSVCGTEIDASACVTAIFQSLGSNQTLDVIELSNFQIKFCDTFHFNNTLKTLKFTANKMDDTVSNICPSLTENTSLTKLNITGSRISLKAGDIIHSLQAHPSLIKLVVSENSISDKEISTLWSSLKQCHLSHLILRDNLLGAHLCDSFSPFLTVLDLSKNLVSNTGPIGESLKSNKTLSWLNLACNNISDSAVPIFEALTCNKSLTYLNLEGLHIDPRSGHAIALSMENNHFLAHLNLSRCTCSGGSGRSAENLAWWCDLLAKNNSLVELILEDISFEPNSLIKGLATNGTLRHLSLKGSEFTKGDSFTEWKSVFSATTSLHSLHLGSAALCSIGQIVSNPAKPLWQLKVGTKQDSEVCTRAQAIFPQVATRFGLWASHKTAKAQRKRPENRSATVSTIQLAPKLAVSTLPAKTNILPQDILSDNKNLIKSPAVNAHTPGSEVTGRHLNWCQRSFARAIWDCLKRGDFEDIQKLVLVAELHYSHFPRGVVFSDEDDTISLLLQAVMAKQTPPVFLPISSHALIKFLIEERVTCLHYFSPPHARALLHKFMTLNKTVTTQSVITTIRNNIACFVREWVRAGNWDAVLEVSLAKTLKNAHLDLSGLSLTNINGNILASLECCSMDLSYNALNSLPYSLHCVQIVNFDRNPLSDIPVRFRSSWSETKKFLRFSEEPVVWDTRKLIVVGDGAAGKTTLTKCMEKKSKTSVKTNVATDGVNIKKFKVGTAKWVVWDLGGQEILYPSHQFFLCSNALFLIVFDLTASAAEGIQASGKSSALKSKTLSAVGFTAVCSKITYWINQINASVPASGSPPKIVLVATHLDQAPDLNTAISLFTQVVRHQPSGCFCSLFCLSCADGTVVQVTPQQKTFHAEVISSSTGFTQFTQRLMKLSSDTEVIVPLKWAKLHARLGGCSEETICWDRFCELAAAAGIGVSKDTEENSAELRMCADFLADSGVLIHFLSARGETSTPSSTSSDEPNFQTLAGYTSAASSVSEAIMQRTKTKKVTSLASTNCSDVPLSELIILNPAWLSDVMKCVISISGRSGWIKGGYLPLPKLRMIFEQQFPKSIQDALLNLLTVFEVIHLMPGGIVLVACMLPDEEETDDVQYLLHKVPTLTSEDITASAMTTSLAFDTSKMIPGSITPQEHFPAEVNGCEKALPSEVELMGRLLSFDFIPIGFFSRLMLRIVGVTGFSVTYMWRMGICMNFTSEQIHRSNCAILCNEKSGTLAIIEAKMHKTPSDQEAQSILKRKKDDALSNLMMVIVSFIRGYYPSMERNMVQTVICPLCLTRLFFGENAERISVTALTHLGAILVSREMFHSFTVVDCVNSLKSGSGVLNHVANDNSSIAKHATDVFHAAPDIAMVNLPLIDKTEITLFSHSHGTANEPVKGGFGKVMRGEWNGNIVAVKEPLAGNSTRRALEQTLIEFLYEAGMMSSISAHPNLVTFHGVSIPGEAEGVLWLVMEFISPIIPIAIKELLGIDRIAKPDLEGIISLGVNWASKRSGTSDDRACSGTLETLLDDFDLVLCEKVRTNIILDIAKGLEHLHSQTPPLTHNDLHSGNIFICSIDPGDTGPWAKIADFGLSEFLFSGVSKGARHNVSTFAPEVLSGDTHDTKADVWSFGMLCSCIINPFATPFDHLIGDPTLCKIKTTTASSTNTNNSNSSGTRDTSTTIILEEHLLRSAVISGRVSPEPPPTTPTRFSHPTWPQAMRMCWHHTPANRASMSQVLSAISSIVQNE
ncbi:leucine-rich-repeat protein [Pelomyxa schiedti]|nr:leucine-rich-repeat protein [Pelomyxa schiedti]